MLIFRKIIIPLALSFIILFTYWDLPKTFFQQDEWWGFAGNIYYQGKGISGILLSFLPGDALSHFSPLAKAYAWLMYLFFYTNFTPYAWISIVLHIINTLLLYYFVLLFLKRRTIATVTALFFGVNSIPHQAITWVQSANSYEIPTAFIILSLVFFHRFIERREHGTKNIVLSLSMLLISLLFHEIGIFLFLFYPVIFFLYAKPHWKKVLPAFSRAIMLFIVVFVLIRIPFFFGLTVSLPTVTDTSSPSASVYPYRLISTGMKSFAGSLFPEKTLIKISEEVVRLAYPQFITVDGVPNPFITQSIVFDLVSYVLTVVILGLMVFFIRNTRDKQISKALVWALFFVPTSLLPYVFVLGKAGFASILESKFFYVSSIGISMLIGIVASYLLQQFSKHKIATIAVYVLLSLYIVSHINAVRMQVTQLTEISSLRKNLLATVVSSYPDIPQSVVFFTQSDAAYYGMPVTEKILPVQVGFGKMLMIWYQKREQFPPCLYEGQFLLDLLAEGYRSCEGRGFGYFRDYDKLIAAMKTYQIQPESVIAYQWKHATSEFADITQVFRSGLIKTNETSR